MQWTSETLNSMCLNRISLMVGHKTEQHEWSNDNSNHSGFVHSDIIIILHSVWVSVCSDINCCRTGQKSEPKIKRRCSRIVKKKPLVFIHHFLINALNWMRNRTIRSVNEFSCSFHLSLLHFPENLVLNLRTSCKFQFKVVKKMKTIQHLHAPLLCFAKVLTLNPWLLYSKYSLISRTMLRWKRMCQ